MRNFFIKGGFYVVILLFPFVSNVSEAGHLETIQAKLQAGGLFNHAENIDTFMQKYSDVHSLLDQTYPKPLTPEQQAYLANIAIFLLSQKLINQDFSQLSVDHQKTFKELFMNVYGRKETQFNQALFAFFLQLTCWQRGVAKTEEEIKDEECRVPCSAGNNAFTLKQRLSEISPCKVWPEIISRPVPILSSLLPASQFQRLQERLSAPVMLYLMSIAYYQDNVSFTSLLTILQKLSDQQLTVFGSYVFETFLENSDHWLLEANFTGQLQLSLAAGIAETEVFIVQAITAINQGTYSVWPAMSSTPDSTRVILEKREQVARGKGLRLLLAKDFECSLGAEMDTFVADNSEDSEVSCYSDTGEYEDSFIIAGNKHPIDPNSWFSDFDDDDD